ncbi:MULTISPECIES: aldehyde dehydrogenase family protein [Aneurinibacillus]|uniref:Aldehyde dehydrogenase (NAD+) n=1 Tax=Aneurinibacillus thermoaerophilus TaxID=143495 RepID=A0A1G7YF66_ANETH|nr:MULTISPECIES: aldehyde dehydrogenase family protein [Aneurinibacillus]AMA72210.1 aldehyde dehydrogenase [Aneurinibacillus sp. XH2]MED0676497.1 aldehyde dehydrogenase family protein [Aneurinibacillus thermoaerophilus]MED0679009.1 aldehyde dehydrogenase family protein [Aneurinibacillus thermoaerophilus]MED0736546.1 aldehyde dehydrogenase family protein [Aneurinibacillus thermoaerophilus]MED0756050.1 aldehyde dehydrogenase family protein [Aneurinibacillus thermoaerophilus]
MVFSTKERDVQLKRLERLVSGIRTNKVELLDILTEIATYDSAEAEIESSISTLLGAEEEVNLYNPPTINRIAVYHSSNVLLYSYVLYAAVPSLFCKEILIRPSTKSLSTMVKLHDFLMRQVDIPSRLLPISQREFRAQVGQPDVVVFTGNYKNSLNVQKTYPQSLFLYFGAGINPFIIGQKANIEDASKRAVAARVYNSGQDCMCPNVYFVHENIKDRFLNTLIQDIEKLQIGERNIPGNVITPLFYDGLSKQAQDYLIQMKDRIVYGGKVDLSINFVEPTVVVSPLEKIGNVIEFFCPIFHVVTYRDEQEVVDWLHAPERVESTLGASVFGVPELVEKLRSTHIVSEDLSLYDIENGNHPFGGYGLQANYVCYQGSFISRPLLISKEVSIAFGSK